MVEKTISKKVIKKVHSYVNLLKQDGLNVEEVFIFGSHAKGTTHSGSDIDVCIISDKFKDDFDDIGYLNDYKFTKGDLLDIEGHGFTSDDFKNPYSSLVNEIKTTGVKIL